MRSYQSPFLLAYDCWKTGLQASYLMAETQTVIGLRVLGMAGMWHVPKSENSRMVQEKAPAFAASAMAAGYAAMNGKRPDQIVNAAIHPLRRKTISNAKRLRGRGPRLG
ncbi:antifreeze protein [Actibacterium sp. 188UL27-1]|uniref:antifreeze protein n=1 Tax=Actibacterium sp. 188UL27-1 TaxID=2786961 RepID=UPI00195A8F3A|nr:antifreeze protein [Actibacterium sp. 188UL27-1]MBM7069600.1 antifreeze protein [Actibacterium sp. 188UL27-1]